MSSGRSRAAGPESCRDRVEPVTRGFDRVFPVSVTAMAMLVPLMRSQIEPALQGSLGRVPLIGQLFSGTPVGLDLLSGGVVLAIMILPILTAVARETLLAVPPTQREAMIGLGATRWEAVS